MAHEAQTKLGANCSTQKCAYVFVDINDKQVLSLNLY